MYMCWPVYPGKARLSWKSPSILEEPVYLGGARLSWRSPSILEEPVYPPGGVCLSWRSPSGLEEPVWVWKKYCLDGQKRLRCWIFHLKTWWKYLETAEGKVIWECVENTRLHPQKRDGYFWQTPGVESTHIWVLVGDAFSVFLYIFLEFSWFFKYHYRKILAWHRIEISCLWYTAFS